MKSLMEFKDNTIGEMEKYIESVLRVVYSTSAYDTAKEIYEKRYKK